MLLTRSQQYVEGLTSYRYQGSPTDPDARRAVSDWLRVFLEAVDTAVDRGLRESPRAGSATARLLDSLQETPVLTAGTAARHLDVSAVAAKSALDELADAGVLRRRRLDRKSTGYLAMDVFELLT